MPKIRLGVACDLASSGICEMSVVAAMAAACASGRQQARASLVVVFTGVTPSGCYFESSDCT